MKAPVMKFEVKFPADGCDTSLVVEAHVGPVQAGGQESITADVRGLNEHILSHRPKPIPEPTVPWALVRFEKGPVLRLGAATRRWVDVDGESYTWVGAQRIYGAPVAISLPRWSDEVDGLRARVEKLADDLDSDADAHDLYVVSPAEQAKIFRSIADRIRALLAEGGEA